MQVIEKNKRESANGRYRDLRLSLFSIANDTSRGFRRCLEGIKLQHATKTIGQLFGYGFLFRCIAFYVCSFDI